METTEMVIAELETKGYIVHKIENLEMGIVNKNCHVVYDICDKDYAPVYGANGIAPDQLSNWLSLPVINFKESNTEIGVSDRQEESKRRIAEKNWDNVYNEGADGYNPYRG